MAVSGTELKSIAKDINNSPTFYVFRLMSKS